MGVDGELAECYGCIVIPQFAAQAMLCGRAELAGRAVVAMEGTRPTEWVCGLNSEAARSGLRLRMTRVEVEAFGNVAIFARSAEMEEAARVLLRAAADRFSPRMEERGEGVDWECILDLRGTERLLGEPSIAAKNLHQAIVGLGFEACVVLCDNADAGLSLARAGRGARVVRPGEQARALAGLRVGLLGLTDEQADRFDSWGIRTLGELAALPEVELVARMGQAGRQLRLRALGRLPHHLEPAEEAFRLEETLEFEEPVETLEPLLFCMNVMLERLVARAFERALALASVTVSLWLERSADCVIDDAEDVNEMPRPALERTLAPRTSELPIRPNAGVARHGDGARVEPLSAPAVGLDSRLGMASANAAVRKAWHRAALIGERTAVPDEPPVRGETLRDRLGIGDGQAMRRKAAALHLVCPDAPLGALTATKLIPGIATNLHNDAPGTATRIAPAVAASGPEVVTRYGRPYKRTIRPAVPLLDRTLLLKMLQLELEAHPAPDAVVRLQLAATSGRAGKVQLGLFSPPMPESTRFEDTHARLASLVGSGNVGRARLLDTHASHCFELERFHIPAPLNKLPEERKPFGSPAIALRHMRPPLAVQVTIREKRIERIWLEGTMFEVERCYGPWRSSGHWWGSEVWSQDMWDIACENNEAGLLICFIGLDLLRERWTVNGIYD